MAYWKFVQGKEVSHLQFKMAKAQHRHHCYSAEEIMNAVMASSDSEQLNTNLDISEVESLQETFKTSSPDNPKLQQKDKSEKSTVSPITSPNS